MDRTQLTHNEANAERVVTEHEAALRHATHKIAWTRMCGRNDAMNPFADPDPPPPDSQSTRPDRHAS
jgi:hypothetical protein